MRHVDARLVVLDVQLDYLVAIHLPGVAHLDGHSDRIAVRNLIGAQLQIRVGKACIGQAIAERIQRLRRQIAVGAALHRIIVEVRQLVRGVVERDGQTSGRAVIAEQQLCHSVTALCARIPRVHNRVHILLRPAQRHCAACAQHQDGRDTGCLHRLEQVELLAGKLDRFAVARRAEAGALVALLALHRLVKAKADDRRVAVLRTEYGLRDAVAGTRQRFYAILVAVAALRVVDARRVTQIGGDAVENRHIVGGGAVVVSSEHDAAVRVRADHRDALLDIVLAQREHAVVFEQRHRLAGRLEIRRAVRRGIVLVVADSVVLLDALIHTQLDAGRHQAGDSPVDLGLGDQTLLKRGEHVHIDGAAVDIAAALERQRRGFLNILRHLVVLMEVEQRPAVGHIMALEAPLAAQDVVHQQLVGAARLAQGAVVRAHHSLDLGLLDARLECREICLPQILLCGAGVELMALALRTAVHGEVLGAGRRFEILRIVALKPLDERHAQTGGQVGILAVRLMAAAPARIAENIDVRGPHRQALIDIAVALRGIGVVLGARLRGDDVRDLEQLVVVEHRGQRDRLREYRGSTGTRDAVQRLVPPVVLRDPQPLHRSGMIGELARLFVERHPGDEIRRALLKRQRRIQIFWGAFHKRIPPFSFGQYRTIRHRAPCGHFHADCAVPASAFVPGFPPIPRGSQKCARAQILLSPLYSNRGIFQDAKRCVRISALYSGTSRSPRDGRRTWNPGSTGPRTRP